MARVVAVHGINKQYAAAQTMAADWVPALLGGVAEAGADGLVKPDDVACVFYGSLFRCPERILGDHIPWYDASDVEPGFEQNLLAQWWTEAARSDPAVVPPDARTLGALSTVQAAIGALLCSRFAAGLSEQALIFWLKQVRRYFTDPQIRATVQERVAVAVAGDTRVMVAHSLGSVAAYEALCAHPEWNVQALVTLGSPLGIRNLIFDRLRPKPAPSLETGKPVGLWPGRVTQWTNIADPGDFVALVKKLGQCFGDRVVDVEVDTGMPGVPAHDVRRYLTARATGRAVADGLMAQAPAADHTDETADELTQGLDG